MALTRLETAILEAVRVGLRAERRTDSTAFRSAVGRVMLAADINARSVSLFGSELTEQLGKLINAHMSTADDERTMRDRPLAGAQPHTMRKSRGRMLLKLEKRGLLTEWHMRAASEIRMLLGGDALFSEGATGGCNLAQLVRVDNSTKVPSWPAGYGHSGQAKARYAKWATAMGERSLPGKAVVDVVVHDVSLRDAERDNELRNGSLAVIIRDALELYALVASIPRLDGDKDEAA